VLIERRTDDHARVLVFEDSVVSQVMSQHRRDRSFADQLGVGGQAEYHRPLGMRCQIDARTAVLYQVEHPWPISIQSGASAVYLVADRWYVDASVSQSRTAPRRGLPASWNVAYGASIGYYLEDSWSVNVSCQGAQWRDAGGSPDYQHAAGISFGVSYRVLGSLDAAGMGVHERPLSNQIRAD
jgi:hypothetical protein